LRLDAGYGPSFFDPTESGFIPELDLFWWF